MEAQGLAEGSCLLVESGEGHLPDESTLKHRHIRPISRCNICLAMDEDLMHALVHCSHAKLFWEQAHALLGVRRPRPHPDTWSRDIICDSQFLVVERAQMISVMCVGNMALQK